MSAMLRPSEPPPARAKALPLGARFASAPKPERSDWTKAVSEFLAAWLLENHVSERDLAAILSVSSPVARKKKGAAPGSQFSIADAGMLPDAHYYRFIADFDRFRRSYRDSR
jgi:hypothetical protein